MTGAVATFHIVGDADAIFLYPYGVPYLNGRFIGFRYGADGACRTHFRTLGALGPAIAAFVGHFRLHQSCEVVAFEELGCESVKKLYVEDFPLVVADDCHGGDIFSDGRAKYCRV